MKKYKTKQQKEIERLLQKMDLGGTLGTIKPFLPALDLLLPGLGTGASMAAGIGQQLTTDNSPAIPLKQTTNIYMKGGLLKKYNAPSHAQGGQIINSLGNPDPKGNAEIELQEAAVTSPQGETYVFSDRLGTAERVKRIYSRMKGDDSISRKGREIATNNLIKENEAMKAQVEQQQQMKYGGKYPLGGGLIPTVESLDAINAQAWATSMVPKLDTPPTRSAMSPYSPVEAPATLPNVWDRQRGLGKTPITKPYDNSLYGGNTSVDSGPSLNPSDSPSSTTKTPLPLDKLGLGLKGLSYIGSAIDAFQGAAKESPRFTDYNRGNRLVAGTGVSDDALQSEIDLQTSKGLDINRQVSGNVGNYLSRAQSILARAGRSKAQTAMQTKQYNDQLSMQKAGRADNIARDQSGELRRVDQNNLANKARSQDLVANFIGNVNNLGSELMRQSAIKQQMSNMNDNQKKDFILKAAALNIQNPNFQIGSLNEIQKALDAGDYDAAVKAIVKFKE